MNPNDTAATTIRAEAYRVSIPQEAVGGCYKPDELRRVAEVLIMAADAADDPRGMYRKYGLPACDFFVWRPFSAFTTEMPANPGMTPEDPRQSAMGDEQ